MESKILSTIGIDPGIIIILMLILIIVLFILTVNVTMNYNRLKSSYQTFMKGKDGKTLEESMKERYTDLESVVKVVKQNRLDIRELNRKMDRNYQKIGVVKYDAFNEMGGNLSFVLTMLNDQNSGWLLNAMHSREGCYTYIKEIINGKSYVELGEEEKESLERGIFQEVYDIKDVDFKKTAKRA